MLSKGDLKNLCRFRFEREEKRRRRRGEGRKEKKGGKEAFLLFLSYAVFKFRIERESLTSKVSSNVQIEGKMKRRP